MPDEDDRREFVLRFATMPGDVPAHLRLKQLLKYARRACGFRCVEAVEVETPRLWREDDDDETQA